MLVQLTAVPAESAHASLCATLGFGRQVDVRTIDISNWFPKANEPFRQCVPLAGCLDQEALGWCCRTWGSENGLFFLRTGHT